MVATFMEFEGFLVVDKPLGWTSRKAVDQASRWFPRRTRIGHTGTLDPLATGVLVLCVGVATRAAEFVQAMPKTYRAGITFGANSDTDDAEGTITPWPGAEAKTLDEVRLALATFLGEQSQVPPAFSAAHVDGARAYAKARRGEAVELQPRLIKIHAIDLLNYAYPQLDLEVRCGKGTYIRSLARDLGARLECGGYLHALRRLRVGAFGVDDAAPWDASSDTVMSRLLPLERGIGDLPRATFDPDAIGRLQHGQRQALPSDVNVESGLIAMLDEVGRWIGLGEIEGALVKPTKVFRRDA